MKRSQPTTFNQNVLLLVFCIDICSSFNQKLIDFKRFICRCIMKCSRSIALNLATWLLALCIHICSSVNQQFCNFIISIFRSRMKWSVSITLNQTIIYTSSSFKSAPASIKEFAISRYPLSQAKWRGEHSYADLNNKLRIYSKSLFTFAPFSIKCLTRFKSPSTTALWRLIYLWWETAFLTKSIKNRFLKECQCHSK